VNRLISLYFPAYDRTSVMSAQPTIRGVYFVDSPSGVREQLVTGFQEAVVGVPVCGVGCEDERSKNFYALRMRFHDLVELDIETSYGLSHGSLGNS
jgi:hypothetical protein